MRGIFIFRILGVRFVCKRRFNQLRCGHIYNKNKVGIGIPIVKRYSYKDFPSRLIRYDYFGSPVSERYL